MILLNKLNTPILCGRSAYETHTAEESRYPSKIETHLRVFKIIFSRILEKIGNNAIGL